jgi:hypothetical protein
MGLETSDEMSYHESWDWLTPVVEKINKLGYTTEKNYQPEDGDWQFRIIKHESDSYRQFSEYGDTSIEACYLVVIKFINDHNRN